MGKLRCVNPPLLSPFPGFSTMVSSMPQASVDSPREALPWLTGWNPSPIAAICGPTASAPSGACWTYSSSGLISDLLSQSLHFNKLSGRLTQTPISAVLTQSSLFAETQVADLPVHSPSKSSRTFVWLLCWSLLTHTLPGLWWTFWLSMLAQHIQDLRGDWAHVGPGLHTSSLSGPHFVTALLRALDARVCNATAQWFTDFISDQQRHLETTSKTWGPGLCCPLPTSASSDNHPPVGHGTLFITASPSVKPSNNSFAKWD